MSPFVDFISQPWPWYVAGIGISLVMFSLIFLGNSFGISSNLRTVCSILGAGKHCEFFDFNWKSQTWNLVFALGMIIGGDIAHEFLTLDHRIDLSEATVAELEAYGIENPGSTLLPKEVFAWENLTSIKGIIMLILGGFLVGFGTRYAGGCTSGHAISGLSNLQLPSLVAVIGFFIGGLTVTYFVLPYLLTQ